jgi:hypothetical protein
VDPRIRKAILLRLTNAFGYTIFFFYTGWFDSRQCLLYLPAKEGWGGDERHPTISKFEPDLGCHRFISTGSTALFCFFFQCACGRWLWRIIIIYLGRVKVKNNVSYIPIIPIFGLWSTLCNLGREYRVLVVERRYQFACVSMDNSSKNNYILSKFLIRIMIWYGRSTTLI